MEVVGAVGAINESFSQIEQTDINEVPEIKEELKFDGEDEMILPDISDVADVDPLQIDNVKQEPEQVSHNCKTGYELWCQDRKVELKAQFPDLSNYKITSRLNKEWKALPDLVKKIWNNRVKPTRQSSRPRKPREIKDISDITVVKKKDKRFAESRQFKRQYITITLYPDNYDEEQILEFKKKQAAAMELRKEKKKKAQKPKLRYTAYNMWAKDVGREILRKECPDMSFSETSRRLSEMWKEIPALEKYNLRRRAKRLNEKILRTQPQMKEEKPEVTQFSSKGRVLAKSKKLSNFCVLEDKVRKRSKVKTEPLSISLNQEAENSVQDEKQDLINNSQTGKKGKRKRSKSP